MINRFQKVLIVLAVLLVGLIALLSKRQPPDKSPQVLVLRAGSISRLANGKAQMWLSRIGADWRAQLGASSPTAQAKIMCKQDSSTVTIYDDIYTQPVCGVRVRLLELTKDKKGLEAGRFQIMWGE